MCLSPFFSQPEENSFENLQELLAKESETVKNLIKFSDKLLLKMTAPRMKHDATLCFNEAEECMINYKLALESATSDIVKNYCRFKYKEALDVRTVASKYLPVTSARNTKQLINELYKESKNEKYHFQDINF